jgi:SAM-dependent methyltransferase
MFAASDAYELYMGRWSRRLAPLYAAFAGVQDGERILDVGTGTGGLAASLPRCEVVGVDPSAAFVEHAAKAIPSARFEVGDAQALRFADASFDQAMALLVLNFIPDHEKALAEMRRVTRPGGTVSACVWDYGDGMESLRVFWDEAVALDAAASPKHERNMKLCREDALGALWRKAGLREVRQDALQIEQAFASFRDYWEPFLRGIGPGGAYVASLAEERRRALEKRLRGCFPDGPFTLRARAWCAKGMN